MSGTSSATETCSSPGLPLWVRTSGAEGLLNQHIFKVESKIDPLFHKYLLDYKLAELMQHTHGSGMVHITKSRFAEVPVALPPLVDQRRIVEILEDHLSRLDAAEGYVAGAYNRVRALENMEVQALLEGQSSAEVPLGQLVSRVEAGRSYGGSGPAARPGEWGIIKVSAMTWGAFRPEENKAVPSSAVDPRFEIRRGDLLVSRANTTAYVGASVLVGDTPPRLLLSDKTFASYQGQESRRRG